MPKFGTDVSSHQGQLTYREHGFAFVIIKATEGTAYRNPWLDQQVAQADIEGVPIGYYHYLRSDGAVRAQAQWFIQQLPPLTDDTTLWVDFEENPVDGNRFTGDEPKLFLDEVYRLTGRQAGVYMNYFMASGAGGRFEWSDLTDVPLWLALYPVADNQAYTPAYQAWAATQFAQLPWFKQVTIWQYGDGGGYDWNIWYEA